MNFAKTLAAALLATVALAPVAQATVINFDHLAGATLPGQTANGPNYTYFSSNTAFTNSGFTFKGANTNYLIGSGYSGNDGTVIAYNGSDFYMTYTAVTITSVTAAPFQINSIDLVHWYDGQGVTQATLTGNKVGGGAVVQVFNVDNGNNASKQTGNDFTTFALAGFDNLSSLTISHNGNYYLAMDNLVVDAATVPEPSSIALFGLAMAGCAFLRRRAP